MSKNIFDLLPDATINESELAFIAGGKKKKKDDERKEIHIPEGGCYMCVCIKSIAPGADGGSCVTGIAG